MSKKFLAYFLLWILLQVLVKVNCQLMPFKPSVSSRHTATLVDNKLYILAGFNLNDKSIKEFFYLDVSVPFDSTQELSWQDLSGINMIPLHAGAASAKGGINNDTLFLYGGYSDDPTIALVYTFDPQNIAWKTQKIAGINTIRKYDLTGVIDYNGKFYLWSGHIDNNIPVNGMDILDTINLSWGKGSLVNAPTPRSNYGATLLPNNKIIYMGGANGNTIYDDQVLNIINGTALALSEVYIYDTVNDHWNTEVTTGKIPSNRAGFSTILGLDGQRVIIYGGYYDNSEYSDTTLYVLDLTNYNWYVPKFSGKIPEPRAFHKANVIGKYMVISFGQSYNRRVESNILLLDISNNEEYIWTTKFDPKSSPPSLPQPPNNSSDNSKMIGAIIGTLLGGIFLLVGSFFLYKWNKNRQSQNNIKNYNNYGQKEKGTNHEPASAIINDDNYHGQEVVTTPNNDGFKFFKLLNKKSSN